MTNTTTRVLLTLVVLALAGVLWLWISRPSAPAPAPAPPPPADGAEPTMPPFTPARPLIANPELGDVNADGKIDKLDVGYLKDFIYNKGQAPLGPADVNGDGKVDVADTFYLTNYLFAHGPAPVKRGGAAVGTPAPRMTKVP